MVCKQCGTEITEGTAFCPNCGTIIDNEKEYFSAENKEYDSIESILIEKIPLANINKKDALVGDKISKTKRKYAANMIAGKKINPEEIIGLIDGTLFHIGIRGRVFTKNAIYEKFNLFQPLVIKYADIDEVWIEKEKDTSKCFVKTNTGLIWTTQLVGYNNEEFAKMIAQLADYAKKHPDMDVSNITTSKEEDNTFNSKGHLIVTIISSIIFSWNSFVIFYNFSSHVGYFWAICAIIVNFIIICGCRQFVCGIFKKKDDQGKWKWIGWGYFVVLFLIFGLLLGHVPYKTRLANSAKSLVTEILEDNYGSWMNVAKCVKVDNVYKITDHYYRATAYLENGNTLQISISDAEKGSIYVEINSD